MSWLNPQYQNVNQYRSYPLADNAEPYSTAGVLLPPGALVDGMLLLRAPIRAPYLAAIDFDAHTLEIADAGLIVAVGTWAEGEVVVQCTDLSGFERPAGLLILGDARPMIGGRHTFSAGVAPFSGAAYTVLPADAVQGIIAEDQLLTGDLKVRGGPGVDVTSYTQLGTAYVEIGIRGVPYEDPELLCLALPPIVQCIVLENVPGARIIASSPEPGVILLRTVGIPSDVGCPNLLQTALAGTQAAQVCEEEGGGGGGCPDPAPGYTGPGGRIVVCAENGAIRIVAAASTLTENALRVVNTAIPGTTLASSALRAARTPEQALSALRTAFVAGGDTKAQIQIKLPGAAG